MTIKSRRRLAVSSARTHIGRRIGVLPDSRCCARTGADPSRSSSKLDLEYAIGGLNSLGNHKKEGTNDLLFNTSAQDSAQ